MPAAAPRDLSTIGYRKIKIGSHLAIDKRFERSSIDQCRNIPFLCGWDTTLSPCRVKADIDVDCRPVLNEKVAGPRSGKPAAKSCLHLQPGRRWTRGLRSVARRLGE